MRKVIFLLLYFCIIQIQLFSQNIALNKPCYANGDATIWGLVHTQANDGNLKTRWQSTEKRGTRLSNGLYADTSWWLVDLQQNYNIEGIRIFWEAAYAVKYNIDVSNDSLNWETIYTQENGSGNEEFLTFNPTNVRYVRIYTFLGNMEWYPSFWEFEVYEHGHIVLDNYTLSFNKGLPNFVQLSSPYNIYKNEIVSFNQNDSILKISGNNDLKENAYWDALKIDFLQNYMRDFSENPVLYFQYQSNRNFLIQINILTTEQTPISLPVDTVFSSNGISEYWTKLNQTDIKLDTIKGMQINFRLLDADTIFVNKIDIGKSAPPFRLSFIYPQRGDHFIENEKATVRLNVFSGKVYFYHDNAFIKEITTYPYSFTFLGLKKGMHKVTAKYYNESNELVDTASIYFVVKIPGENSLRDSATERLYSTLKYTASIGYPMFGMQMPTTRGYTEGSFNFSWNTSDCKDITGSHPAFHEADFSHYSPIPNDFQKLELMALKEAVKRGAVVGFCWHMGGRYTNNIYVNGDNTNPDAKLVHEIVSDTNRLTNPALDWYLTKYDQIAIPVFKEMGCPIFFRPLHEMTGNWFWWGSVNTPNDVAKLFALTVKYIRSKGVKNVLYVWSPNLSTDFSFYPGDEYVDVIGYDGYQIGVASYASISKVLKDLSTLTDYAYSHNKIAAFTETGLDQTNGYPSIYPDWWTKKLFNPIINHPKAHRLAWIETWCNSGTFWIPYKGCNAKNCDLAVNDFIEFYKYPNTIFENDIPDMYGFKDDLEGGFIYPDSVVLNEGQSLKIFGGTYSKWFLGEKQQWIINNENIGIIDSTGLIEAKNEGNTFIKLMNNNIIIDSIPLIVKKNLSIINRENNNSKCLVFSNPVFSNSFEIQIPENTNGATIELINIQGAIIKKFRTYEKNLQINTKHLNKGIYYVRILLINKSETCKVIIQ